MAEHDYVIDNQSAPSFRTDLNNALMAIVSQNSKSTAPTTTYANMIWYDTTNNQLKKRNEANSAWITLGTIDESAGTFTPSGSTIPATQTQTVWNAGVSTTESTITAAKLHGKLTDAFNGGTGEPRVVGSAMFSTSAGTTVLRNCLPFGSEVASTTSTSNPAVVPIYSSAFTAIVSCEVQVFLTFTKTTTQTGSVEILKNGSVIQTYVTNQTGTTLNVTLAAGDTLGVRANAATNTNGSSSTTTISALQYRVDTRSAIMT